MVFGMNSERKRKVREEKEKKEREENKKINNIIKNLQKNQTSVWNVTLNFDEAQYDSYIIKYDNIMYKIRKKIKHAKITIHKHMIEQSLYQEPLIEKITIYYYTDYSKPQPPPEPPQLSRIRHLQSSQHADVLCCILL